MKHKVRPEFGTLVRDARKSNGWSQERIAYAVHVEQTEISKIERGKLTPSAELAMQIAGLLEIPENECFEDGE
jgi:transcriptional regulator with XRE-family HTH domain